MAGNVTNPGTEIGVARKCCCPDVDQATLIETLRLCFFGGFGPGCANFPAAALAEYRNDAIFLRTSRYVPPRWEVVGEAMRALFELLEHEPEACVRAVLGHWMFGIFTHSLTGMDAWPGFRWTLCWHLAGSPGQLYA